MHTILGPTPLVWPSHAVRKRKEGVVVSVPGKPMLGRKSDSACIVRISYSTHEPILDIGPTYLEILRYPRYWLHGAGLVPASGAMGLGPCFWGHGAGLNTMLIWGKWKCKQTCNNNLKEVLLILHVLFFCAKKCWGPRPHLSGKVPGIMGHIKIGPCQWHKDNHQHN